MSQTSERLKPGPPPGYGSKGERDQLIARAPAGTRTRLEALKRALKYDSVSELIAEMIANELPTYETRAAAAIQKVTAEK